MIEVTIKPPIRLSSKKNPLGLSVGERVVCSATSHVRYDDKGERCFDRRTLTIHKELRVVGIVRKAIAGSYCPATQPNYHLDQEYEPAYLANPKYQLFYECKRDIYSKSVLVHPDDIEIKE